MGWGGGGGLRKADGQRVHTSEIVCIRAFDVCVFVCTHIYEREMCVCVFELLHT